jgi:hypothetical protein
MLLIPLATGGAVGVLEGGNAHPLLPFSIASLAVFCLRTPVESWLGTTAVRARTLPEIRLVRTATLALAVLSAAALAWLFWGEWNRGLLWIGAAAALAFAAQAVVKRAAKRARTLAQTIGAAGLTAVAPGAYCAAAGEWNATAAVLWMANLLFATNQIHFVQLRIHAARAKSAREKLLAGRGFLAGQMVLVTVLACAWGLHLVHAYAALAFLPVLWRGFAWFAAASKPLAIHVLGLRELAHACAFGLLLILAFHWS